MTLKSNNEDLGIEVSDDYKSHPGKHLQAIIKTSALKYGAKVVILIDEYDKPILDNIHKEDKTPASEARDILREFYSDIKDSDECKRFVFSQE